MSVRFDSDPIACCAKTVITDFAEQLPDLSSVLILLPQSLARIRIQQAELRAQLLDHARQRGFEALIPPKITTPRKLFLERYTISDVQMSERRAKLLLAGALEKYQHLFPAISKWQLADELIAFFDEVSDYDSAQAGLKAGFEQHAKSFQPIWNDDTKMLVGLWQIWQDLFDETNNTALAWQRALISGDYINQQEYVYLCGINHLSACFAVWAQRVYQQGRMTLITQATSGCIPTLPNPTIETVAKISGQTPTQSDNAADDSKLLDYIFATKEARPTQLPPSTLSERLRLFLPMNTEEHVWGIYAVVRQWITDQWLKIGIVSPDRRLSRRLRAVFESYGIHLIDYTGWELSTTSSAAALKNLLPESGVALSMPTVLTLLRSPYCDYQIPRDSARYLAEYIEDILARHQINQTPLVDAVQALKVVDKKAPHPAIAQAVQVATALIQIEQLNDGDTHAYTDYFACLFKVMNTLGMEAQLKQDDAGKKLLVELHDMRQAAQLESASGNFVGWQGWIMHNLEHVNYVPPLSDSGVFLMNPKQAQLMKFDALAILSVDDKHFPTPPQSRLVNENIRRELHLENYEQVVGRQFQQFRALLDNAKTLVLSCQQYVGSQKTTLSPWLNAIKNFHYNNYQLDLTDHQLQTTAKACVLQAPKRTAGAPPQIKNRPAPPTTAFTWPSSLSVRAYQTIVDCPYQFFVRYQLAVRARDKVPDYWQAKQYGIHLHRCLQALHTDLPDLPGPLEVTWTEAHRGEILALAARIVAAQFGKASRYNYANQFWQNDALAAMDYYVDWAIEQWQDQPAEVVETEVSLRKNLADGLDLYGIADLLIRDKRGEIIIDYKSGKLPSEKHIKMGEDVQLTSYALLRDNIKSAFYLGLKKEARHRQTKRQEDSGQLGLYSEKTQQRLLAIKTSYDANASLPAWGSNDVCKYCSYDGICRKPTWEAYQD